MTLERILELTFWSEPVSTEPITGGITNRNYLVRCAEQTFVARLCADRSILGIDRCSERMCQRFAARLGIAPQLVHEAPGILISEFLSARTMTPGDVRNETFLCRLAKTLRTLHDSWDSLTGEILYFCPFQTVRTYVANARVLNAALPEGIDAIVEGSQQLSRAIDPFRPVLCHNDLLAANLMDDGAKLWLVDWEYAGIGHPLFDIASVSGNCSLTSAEEAYFLEAYLQASPSAQQLREVHILKTVSLLREALWALLQQATADIDFDYARYAATNFQAYLNAISTLSQSLDSSSKAG